MKNKLNAVNALALQLHGGIPAADAFTFQSLREHIDEVQGLLAVKDPHWKDEVIDIIIHGYLLLGRYGVGSHEIRMIRRKRLKRFKEKIGEALKEKEI